MHEKREGKVTSPVVSLGGDSMRIIPIAVVIGLLGLGGSFAVSWFSGGFQRFSFAYLVNFCFFCSITLGALFFVTVQHLTRAGWSVTVRRIAEILAVCILPLFLLFLPIVIPVLFGYSGLYEWNNTAMMKDDHILSEKVGYLNRGFFGLRVALYFVIWIGMAVFFYRNSLRQDETGNGQLTSKMQAWSAPLMLLLAATLVFASFDFEMSLAPLWYSTIFPVYFFAGAVLSGTAMIAIVAILLQRSGRVTDEITVEHYHDLAKLMFAFIVFWGYIAFSQFLLIWYANIPEETFWYQFRFNPGWIAVSVLLLFGHLFIPFLGIMARTVRRNRTFVFFAALFLLFMHWVDHYWLIMPQLNASIPSLENSWPMFGLVEILGLVGMTGFYVASFCVVAGDRALVPLKDPRLVEALNFENP